MKLEEIVTSLELSKRLRELDIDQGRTLFIWDNSNEVPRLLFYKEIMGMNEKFLTAEHDYYSAFTASELIDFFPTMISTIKDHDKKFISVYEKVYGLPFINDHTEANCRAKILIHLIENKLIDPKEV